MNHMKKWFEHFDPDKSLLNNWSVAKQCIKQYGIQASKIIPLKKNGYNFHYKVITDNAIYCLKKYKSTRLSEELKFDYALNQYLKSNGYHKLVNYRLTCNGNSYIRIKNESYVLLDWIEKGSILTNGVKDVQVNVSAKELAQLHAAMIGFKPTNTKRLSPDPCLMSADRWWEVSTDFFERLNYFADRGIGGFNKKYREVIKTLISDNIQIRKIFDKYNYEKIKAENNIHYVHGDYRPLNIVCDGDEMICLLDFDDVHKEIRLYDICFASIGFGDGDEFLGEHNLKKIRLFVEAYYQEWPLSLMEEKLLPWYYKLLILRWLAISWRDWQFDGRLELYLQFRETCEYI